MKIILIIDNPLKSQERKLLDSHLTTYEVKKEDWEKWMMDLPDVDVYIVSAGSYWWDLNRDLPDKKIRYASVYYSKGRLKDPTTLRSDFIINRFPTMASEKNDLILRLCHNSLPKPKTTCGLCCGFCLSQITMKDFCKSLFSCCQCL